MGGVVDLYVGTGGVGGQGVVEVAQSVMLNLAMLIPASSTLAIAVLTLQRRGRLSRCDLLAGPATWLTVMAMMGVAVAADGMPLLSDSPLLRTFKRFTGMTPLQYAEK